MLMMERYQPGTYRTPQERAAYEVLAMNWCRILSGLCLSPVAQLSNHMSSFVQCIGPVFTLTWTASWVYERYIQTPGVSPESSRPILDMDHEITHFQIGQCKCQMYGTFEGFPAIFVVTSRYVTLCIPMSWFKMKGSSPQNQAVASIQVDGIYFRLRYADGTVLSCTSAPFSKKT